MLNFLQKKLGRPFSFLQAPIYFDIFEDLHTEISFFFHASPPNQYLLASQGHLVQGDS